MSRSEQYDNQISSLYQQQSTELPSAQIDANIASMAKQHLAENPKVINPKFARKFSALKWQWPVSIAASVMLVSVIFVNNQSEFIPHSTLPESVSQPPISAAPEDESQRLAIVPEPIDTQDPSNMQVQSDVQEQRNIQKQNDLQYAAIEAKTKLQDKGQESEKRAISNARAPQIETQMAALKKQHQQLQKTVATESLDYHGGSEYFDSTQSEEIVVTGSRLSSDVASTAEAEVQVRFKQQISEDSKLSLSAFERLDTELLDRLVVDYEQLQAQSVLAQEQERTDNLVARLNQTKTLTPQAREHAIQQAIFEYLLGFQQANPDTQLPDKYVSILSPQMKVELSRSLGQNHPSHTENTKKDQQ